MLVCVCLFLKTQAITLGHLIGPIIAGAVVCIVFFYTFMCYRTEKKKLLTFEIDECDILVEGEEVQAS